MGKRRTNTTLLIGGAIGLGSAYLLYIYSQKFTRDFTYSDLTRSAKASELGIVEQFKRPPARIVHQARQFARIVLQPISDILNAQLVVTGWYRHPLLNQALKGATNSGHLEAEAIDVQVWINGVMDNNEIIRAVVASGVPFTKIISEYGTFINPLYIHIRYTPKINTQLILRKDADGYHILTLSERQQLGI